MCWSQQPDDPLDATLPPELKMLSLGPSKEAGTKLTTHSRVSAYQNAARHPRMFHAGALPLPNDDRRGAGATTKRPRNCVAKRSSNTRPRRISGSSAIERSSPFWVCGALPASPSILEQAAREARDSLTVKLPPGAELYRVSVSPKKHSGRENQSQSLSSWT